VGGLAGAMVEREDVQIEDIKHRGSADGGGGIEEKKDVEQTNRKVSPKQAQKMSAQSEKKAGHKRAASQSTLDGLVTRKKKKEEKDGDVFPNATHFG
jgi:hypothetical protein